FIEPDFKLIESIEPYLIDLLDKKLKFTYFFKKIENTFDRFSFLISEIPDNIEIFIDTIKKLNKKYDFDEEMAKNLNLTIKKTGTKISLVLLTCSIFICSVFLFALNYFHFSIFGFSLAFFLIIILIFLKI
ncbi:MAG: hypothetical protein NC833_05765, partial [Candidatus Omnitrophica bacterium]|nr:hypothetical protein [Candidatus Omnitrophota bacterium]